MITADEALEQFKIITTGFQNKFNEADTRAKIIEPIFKTCLGWEESDFRREKPVKKGFIDYTLRNGDFPFFIIEAKEYGRSFKIPSQYNSEKYRLNGTITTDSRIKDAIDQVAKYNNELGCTYAVITNGHQFIIFQAYKKGSQWRNGDCYIFRSYDHIINKFTLFWNLLSKSALLDGSIHSYFSDSIMPLDFSRPLSWLHNANANMGKNEIAKFVSPIVRNVFDELIHDNLLEVLQECYITQRETSNYDGILGLNFHKLPYYSKKYNIEWFRESKNELFGFKTSYIKSQELLKDKRPAGSLIVLLGGIGSGKTTFIHHFFKIHLKDQTKLMYFFVDFSKSEPKLEDVEPYIYESIISQIKNNSKFNFEKEVVGVNMDDVFPTHQQVVMLFGLLTLNKYNLTIVLDNVDHHSYTTPSYQERVFEYAQRLSSELNATIILNLREESFFRTTKSGVLDSVRLSNFHISPPPFERVVRRRIDYVISLLNKDNQKINDILGIIVDSSQKKLLLMFYEALKASLRSTRYDGQRILRTVNNISGGNIRQALEYFSIFMTSGNTNVANIFRVETAVPENALQEDHYQIPHHDILSSIIIGDNKFYHSNKSHILNLFQVLAPSSISHFIHLKILNYLYNKREWYIALEKGFVRIDDLLYNADESGISRKAIMLSLTLLADHNLINFNNQRKDGLNDATYVKITSVGIFYHQELISNFTYIDYMWQDTLISDKDTYKYLTRAFSFDDIKNTKTRIAKRFERCDKFMAYLKQREINEFKEKPTLLNNEFSRAHFIDSIIAKYEIHKQEIQTRI